MAVEVMTWVWNYSRAKHAARLVLLAIADSAGVNGEAQPTVEELQMKANLSSDRSVQGALKALVELGELKIRYNEGEDGSNIYKVLWDPAKPAGGDPSRSRLLKQLDPANFAGGQNLRGPAKFAGGTADDGPLDEIAGHDGDPRKVCGAPQNLPPANFAGVSISTRVGARAPEVGRKVGTTPPTYLPEPTDRAHEREAGGQEDGAHAEPGLAEFIYSLDLGRPLVTDEFERLAKLITEKLTAGWTKTEIKNAGTGRWANVNDRVAVVISRLRKLPPAPPPRPKPAAPRPDPAPVDPAEIRAARDHADFQAARSARRAGTAAAAQARSQDEREAYRLARRALDDAEPKDRDSALAQARAQLAPGRADVRAQTIRAAQILGELNAMSYRQGN